MLDWHASNAVLSVLFHGAQTLGNDTSPVNLFLLGDKYGTEVAVKDGILFRYYRGDVLNRRGYGFPISPDGFDGETVLALLRIDAERRGEPLAFCLCDERQRKFLDEFCNVRWRSFDGDSDYITSGKALRSSPEKSSTQKRIWSTGFGGCIRMPNTMPSGKKISATRWSWLSVGSRRERRQARTRI